MIIDNIIVNTEAELEALILNYSEESKVALRSVFLNSTPPAPSQKELDYNRYLKRAQAKDIIIAEMASENMERVRSGVWTVNDLINLTQDTELKLVLDDVNTLSYELAAGKVATITNSLITQQIKDGWIFKLQSHFYL